MGDPVTASRVFGLDRDEGEFVVHVKIVIHVTVLVNVIVEIHVRVGAHVKQKVAYLKIVLHIKVVVHVKRTTTCRLLAPWKKMEERIHSLQCEKSSLLK